MHVVVVGAGAFGGWTALHLRRSGAEVTLVDAWGPGHARSSSGGETRAIRAVYGDSALYTRWVADSLVQWRAADGAWGTTLLRETGVLWLCAARDPYLEAARPHLDACGLALHDVPLDHARARWPQVDFDDVGQVCFEPAAGRLRARRACEAVATAAVAEGVTLRIAQAHPPSDAQRPGRLELGDGSRLEADAFVFACGPWLPTLFPDLALGLRVSRQEVFFFGPPPGANEYGESGLPVFVDTQRGYYGLPGSEERGFKVADHGRGPDLDPTRDDRVPSDAGRARARGFVEHRFPGLRGAPLVDARVCAYTNAPDEHLLCDRHPGRRDVWLLGAGSGHGFKLAPALGAHAAACVLGRAQPQPELTLARLRAHPSPDPSTFGR